MLQTHNDSMSFDVKFQFPVSADIDPAIITNNMTTTLMRVNILLNRADSFTPKHKTAATRQFEHS